MPFFLLALLSLAGASAAFFYANNNGGTAAVLEVSGQALTGTMLYAIAALLVVAAALFVVAGVMKAIRRIVALVATIALIVGGGIGGFAPLDIAQYEREKACKVIDNQCQKITPVKLFGK